MKHRKVILSGLLFVLGLYVFFIRPESARSGALSNVKDTLSNSRLSYEAGISAIIASGETTITIDGSGNPDVNTGHLFPGDVICFTNALKTGCIGNTTYTVGTIISSTSFSITSALSSGLIATDAVVATQSATHTITFVTSSSVADGSIVLRVPAATTTAASNDGFADQGTDSTGSQGFDLNSLAAGDVTCSGGAPAWGAETITSSVTSGSGEHEIVCPFTGTLAAGVTVTATLGNTVLRNPVPATDHTQGVANDLQISVLEYDHNTPGSGNLIDSSDTAVAPIEAVFVSATVDESLSFVIAGVSSATTACGASTDVTSTFSGVPFGSVGLNTFYDIAHGLEVSTNASNGYAVTAAASDQMGLNGGVCTGDAGIANDCIPDTVCDGSSCTHLAAAVDDWETASTNGFGYSLDSTDGTDAAWEWDGTSGTCDGSGTDFCAAQFADTEGSQSPVTIMSNNGAVNSKNMYVCYRLSVGALQPAGYYYNKIKYTATPTF